MKTLLRYLELVFTVAGIAVIFLVTKLFTPDAASQWRVAAITATAVGIIHGLLFWFVRRRQRELRHAAIFEVQAMLQDIINNKLAVIQMMAELREARPAEAQRACTYITQSVTAISVALKQIDDEQIRSWQVRYPERAAAAR